MVLWSVGEPIAAGSWAITSAYAGGVQLRGVRKCHLWTVPQDIRQFSSMRWVFVGDSRSGKRSIFPNKKRGVTKEPAFAHRLMLKLARFIHCSYLSGVGSLRRAAFICIREFRFGNWLAFCTKVQYSDKNSTIFTDSQVFTWVFISALSIYTVFLKAQQYNYTFTVSFFQRLFHTFLFQQGGHPFSLTNPPRRQKPQKMHLHVRLLSGRTASVDLTADAYVYELRRTAERELGVGIASLSRSDVGDLS